MKSLDDYSETLPALRKKREYFFVEISKRKLRCAEIRTRLQSGGLPNTGNDHENRVNALLNRPSVETVLPDAALLQTLLVELDALQRSVCEVDAAILVETRTASNKFLKEVKPEVTRRGINFAKAFLALRSEHLEYNRYVDSIANVGANVESIRLYPNGLSDPSDASGNYAYAAREFANMGYLSKSQAPEMI